MSPTPPPSGTPVGFYRVYVEGPPLVGFSVPVDGRLSSSFAVSLISCVQRWFPRGSVVANKNRVPVQVHGMVPVAPVAYQVILEPGIGQFREFESPRVHTRIKS